MRNVEMSFFIICSSGSAGIVQAKVTEIYNIILTEVSNVITTLGQPGKMRFPRENPCHCWPQDAHWLTMGLEMTF